MPQLAGDIFFHIFSQRLCDTLGWSSVCRLPGRRCLLRPWGRLRARAWRWKGKKSPAERLIRLAQVPWFPHPVPGQKEDLKEQPLLQSGFLPRAVSALPTRLGPLLLLAGKGHGLAISRPPKHTAGLVCYQGAAGGSWYGGRSH